MKIAVIINAKRATKSLIALLNSNELATKYNLPYDVFIVPPDEMSETLKHLNHQTYNAYIIGGGDGTVRAATEVLIDQDIPLVILPLGTFNVLAKTLNYPNDIDALFAMIKNNKTKQIDLALVNNHVMINHTWIGFYTYILKLREKHKDVLGRSKLLKIIFNAFNAFKVLPIYHLEVKANNETMQYETCLIYISNNESGHHLLNFGERKSLSTGLLVVTILNCKTRWDLFSCMLSVITNQFKNSKYVTQFATDELTITAQSNLINLVIDGDLFKLETPLHLTNHQKKLKVIIP